MAELDVQQVMEETNKELSRDDLTTQVGKAQERQIKLEEKEDTQLPAAVSTAPPANPYAGLTNSGPRKRKAAMEKDGSPGSNAHPHAPAPRKTKKKKAVAPGKLVDTRSRQRYGRGDIVHLKYVVTLIRLIKEALASGCDHSTLLNKLRERLHEIEFNSNLCYQLVKDSKLLEPQGLPQIFGESLMVVYPHDVVDDSLVLYQKWSKELFDSHLLHGIELQNHVQPNGKTTKSYNLLKNYPFKVSALYVGAGDLINGQWWPLQICLIRDGVHGEIEAGICGVPGKGAFSIVVSSGGYDNIDEGDTIKYCGTSGSLGKETGNTNLMRESLRLRNPVRVIRSSASHGKKKSVYQPVKGMRYDGLYEVVEDELLDQQTAMHRFTLRRLAGQSPVRYIGVEARPTPEEQYQYTSIREALGRTS